MQGGSDSKNCGTRITKLRVVVEKIWLKEVFFGGGGKNVILEGFGAYF
jgi:hypothetical protein